MGRGKRFQPTQLAGKMKQIRERLRLNQIQMFNRLGDTESKIYASHVSSCELGTREPPLDILMLYARIAGVPVEVLIDDKLELPQTIPGEAVFEWVLIRRERNA